MANIDELQEKAEQQLAELNLIKSDLISALDKLIIKPESVFNLPSSVGGNIPMSFKDNLNDYTAKIKTLLEDNDVGGVATNYLNSLKAEIEDIIRQKDITLTETNLDKFNVKTRNIINYMSIIYDEFVKYLILKRDFKQLSFNAISDRLAEVKDELSSFRRLRNIADTALTENIYNNAVTKYKGLEDKYRFFFYLAIFFTISISVIMFFNKIWLVGKLGTVEFWVLKASILVVGITLISYFIKQSSHYQRLADQNYQTQVELQAFPSFMNNVPANEAAIIRKELALKYFGKEIDGSPHKDLSNLISDQIKSSTDLVKVATDILKKE